MANRVEATEEVTETDEQKPDDEQDENGTYPAKIVKDLRKENANHRERNGELSRQLFTARVAATGKVVNPDEIPFDATLLDDSDGLNRAIDELLERKPYLKVRKVEGDVGQGQRGKTEGPQDFSALLRG